VVDQHGQRAVRDPPVVGEAVSLGSHRGGR
jgi:hypothetical protein